MDYRRRTELACDHWLLDRLEDLFRDMPPRCASVQELATRLGAMAGVPFVVAVLAAERGEPSSSVLERHVLELLSGHAVAYLAALRHTEPGLEKRAQWEAAWAQQRLQDTGELVELIPAPPDYDRTDYQDSATFRHRGKLDVVTEPFIIYRREGDAESRYGWAGWTPVQQGEALVALVEQCQDEGQVAEHLAPLLAGILELVPWMPSWHGATPAPGTAAETFLLRVQHEAGRVGLDFSVLRAWRPSDRDQRRQGTGDHRS